MAQLFQHDLAEILEQFHIEDEREQIGPLEFNTLHEMSDTETELIYNAYKLGYLKGYRKATQAGTIEDPAPREHPTGPQ